MHNERQLKQTCENRPSCDENGEHDKTRKKTALKMHFYRFEYRKLLGIGRILLKYAQIILKVLKMLKL